MRLPALTELTPRQQEVSDKIEAGVSAESVKELAGNEVPHFAHADEQLLSTLSMLAMLLNTFQVDLKPGDEPPFPDVRGFAKADAPQILRLFLSFPGSYIVPTAPRNGC
jgi:hypothetical protein